MKYQGTLAYVVCLALVLASPAVAQAQVFSDSFENDATGTGTFYGLPDTGSTPPWGVFKATGVTNTTPSDSHYNDPNGGVFYLYNHDTPIPGQDGSYYLVIGNSGGDGDNDMPPFTDRTPSAQTATLSTSLGAVGKFQANTTYTLSVLISINNGDTTLSGSFSLLDGTTSTVLNSYSLIATTAPNSNFNAYSLTFDTASSSVVGDNIQIGLTAAQSAAQPFNRSVAFDDVVLTSAVDVPEPTAWAMMATGLLVLAGFQIRSRFKRV